MLSNNKFILNSILAFSILSLTIAYFVQYVLLFLSWNNEPETFLPSLSSLRGLTESKTLTPVRRTSSVRHLIIAKPPPIAEQPLGRELPGAFSWRKPPSGALEKLTPNPSSHLTELTA